MKNWCGQNKFLLAISLPCVMGCGLAAYCSGENVNPPAVKDGPYSSRTVLLNTDCDSTQASDSRQSSKVPQEESSETSHSTSPGFSISAKETSHVINPDGLKIPKLEDSRIISVIKPGPYGWEFFGLTKSELEQKVSTEFPVYVLNSECTFLGNNSGLGGRSLKFDYQNERIEKVSKQSYGIATKQFNGTIENLNQALRLADSDYSRYLAEAQIRLNTFLVNDSPNAPKEEREREIENSFGHVAGWYYQRAIVREKIGQYELAQADFCKAIQLQHDALQRMNSDR